MDWLIPYVTLSGIRPIFIAMNYDFNKPTLLNIAAFLALAATLVALVFWVLMRI